MGRMRTKLHMVTVLVVVLSTVVAGPPAHAGSSCDKAGGHLAISGADSPFVLDVNGNGLFRFSSNGIDVPCNGAPSVTNIDTIGVGTTVASETLTVSFGNGYFVPGLTSEPDNPEIEMDIDMADGDDTLRLEGTPGSDRIRVGRAGFLKPEINLNGDSDIDVDTEGIELIEIETYGGRDTISGTSGNGQSTGPSPVPLVIYPGSGDDKVTGGAEEDILNGQEGADRINAVDDRSDAVHCGPSRGDYAKVDRNLDANVLGCETKKKVSS